MLWSDFPTKAGIYKNAGERSQEFFSENIAKNSVHSSILPMVRYASAAKAGM